MHLKKQLIISFCFILILCGEKISAQEVSFDFQNNTKMVDSNGEKFPVIDYGSGPVIVLLHGFPDTKELWRNQIPTLASAGYRVIAPDLRGYGDAPRSMNIEKYAIPALMEDVIGIMDGLKIGKAHLVGHDWGAGLGWGLANYYEHRFLSYVTLSVGIAGTKAWNSIAQREKAWYFYFFMQEGLTEVALKKNDWELFKAFGSGHPDLENIIAQLSESNGLTTALNWYRGNFGHLLAPCDVSYEGDGTYFTPPSKKVNVPVLGVWGDNDPYLLEPQMIQSKEGVAGSFIYKKVIGAGHWLMLDKPEEVNKLLLDFISKNN